MKYSIDNTKEEWRSIKGFEGLYEVSNFGNVKSYVENKSGKLMIPGNNQKGYKQLILRKNGKPYSRKVHRLVAEAFVENPSKLPQINHIDEDKANNKATNLEWCSAKYNANYGSRKKVRGKVAYRYDLEGNLIDVWATTLDASKELGIARANILECIKGKRKTAGGYIWGRC